jgi:hypothetical protein
MLGIAFLHAAIRRGVLRVFLHVVRLRVRHSARYFYLVSDVRREIGGAAVSQLPRAPVGCSY